MAIQKKSLISNQAAAKKAVLAKSTVEPSLGTTKRAGVQMLNKSARGMTKSGFAKTASGFARTKSGFAKTASGFARTTSGFAKTKKSFV